MTFQDTVKIVEQGVDKAIDTGASIAQSLNTSSLSPVSSQAIDDLASFLHQANGMSSDVMSALGTTSGSNQATTLGQSFRNACNNLSDLFDRTQAPPNAADILGDSIAAMRKGIDHFNGPDSFSQNIKEIAEGIGMVAKGAELYFNSNGVVKEGGFQLMRAGLKEIQRNAMDLI